LVADINTSSTIVSGISRPYDIDVTSLVEHDTRSIAVFEQMYSDYTTSTQTTKLKFITCDGVKAKFDIVSCTASSITFNVISKGKFYQGTFTKESNTMAKLVWGNNAEALSNVFNQVVSLGTFYNNHESRLSVVEANVATALGRTTWHNLDV